MRKNLFLLAAVAVFAVFEWAATARADVRYAVTDLGTLPDATVSGHGGTVTDLGVPYGNTSNATGINTLGQIASNSDSTQVGADGGHSYILSN
jgi:hypothetical protein